MPMPQAAPARHPDASHSGEWSHLSDDHTVSGHARGRVDEDGDGILAALGRQQEHDHVLQLDSARRGTRGLERHLAAAQAMALREHFTVARLDVLEGAVADTAGETKRDVA